MGNHLKTYLSLILLEALLAYVVIRRVRKDGGLRRFIAEEPFTIGALGRDLLIAAAIWTAWTGFTHLWATLRPEQANHTVATLLPSGAIESIVWIALSCSAGFAEELAFRGALQRWGERKFGDVSLAIVVQALIFGVVHGYQGTSAVARIVVYGAFFGVVAHWRRSLVPGMLAHAWTDIAAGLL